MDSIKLMLFKPNGKYYSEREIKVESYKSIYEIVDIVNSMVLSNELPPNFDILIAETSDKNSSIFVPHIVKARCR